MHLLLSMPTKSIADEAVLGIGKEYELLISTAVSVVQISPVCSFIIIHFIYYSGCLRANQIEDTPFC